MYEIKSITVTHPEIGNLSKHVIIYYNLTGEEISREHYQEGLDIKQGFTAKQ
jgi:hypothetical protein